MQQIPETEEQGFLQQRMVAALTSLAELALQSSRLCFSALETREQFAGLFLDQLVALCAAQQGALFFLSHDGTDVQRTVQMQRDLLPAARTRLSIVEAQAALNSAAWASTPLQWSTELPASVIWRRPLDAVQAHQETIALPLAPQLSALVLLVWPLPEQGGQNDAQRQALQLLPSLADLIDAILLHIHRALYDGGKPSADVFPAELLATVGHEFRGPLTTIQGYATTLLRHDQQLAPGERQDFLHAINEASVHLGRLIDRFLELALFETHTHVFTPTAVNVLSLAQESITAVQKGRLHRFLLIPPLTRQPAPEASASAETLEEELTISGDRRLLRTMLDLLLENAIAYSAPESLVEIFIEPIETASALTTWKIPGGSGKQPALILPASFEENEPLLAIHVRDHGIGISPEHLSLIFRRFYRVDTRLTRDVNGLGLGLALCKAIVALHGGMLRVESAVGEGSTFSIVLARGRLQELVP